MTDSTTVTVKDPEMVVTKSVDKSGRLYLGNDYAEKRVRVVIESVEE